MQIDIKWPARDIWSLFVGGLFLASVLIPSSRELHILYIRLIFGLNGNTVVQGQPSGCFIYTVPNVDFASDYSGHLRRRAPNSADDFGLATLLGENQALQFPRAYAWTNHTLMNWGAVRLTWAAVYQMETAESTNQIVSASVAKASLQIAKEVVRESGAREPTNGVWSLAEADIHFAEQNKNSAFTALAHAASNRHWKVDTITPQKYLSKSAEFAGLSELDAAIRSSWGASRYAMRGLEGQLLRQIDNQMTEAISNRLGSNFAKWFGILVELRQAFLQSEDPQLINAFQHYRPSDELIAAMSGELRRQLPEGFFALGRSETPYEVKKRFRTEVFDAYLTNKAPIELAWRFLGQRDVAATRQGLSWSISANPPGWLGANLGGYLGLLTGGAFLIAGTLQLAFVFLRKRLRGWQDWLQRWPFSILAMVAVAGAAWLMFRVLDALGSRSVVGFPIETRSADHTLGMWAASILLPSFWFGALFADQKSRPSPAFVLLILAAIYCATVMATGISRSLVAEALLTGNF